MKVVKLIRDKFYDGQASLGVCYVYQDESLTADRIFKSVSLERGWVNNKNRISCIPEGDYPLGLEWSPRFERYLWEIYEVPNRAECKFHAANYWHQLNGCIALGRSESYIDGDNVLDVAFSVDTMKKFHRALKGDVTAILKVRNLNNLL